MATRSRVDSAAKLPEGRFPKLDLPLPVPYPAMEAKRASSLPKSGEWQFEPKWDGFRCIAFRDGDEVVLQSKAGQPLTRYFPEVAAELRKLPQKKFALDGEIVIPVGGRLSFDDLLLRVHPAESRIRKLAAEIPGQYYVFDLLVEPQRGGKATSIVSLPIEERRLKLEEFFTKVPATSPVKLSPSTRSTSVAREWFEKFTNLGLDGVMAKRIGEQYRSGDREGMVKIKHFHTADCVVGGFRWTTDGHGIASLLLGLYDEAGRLVYVGHAASFTTEDRKKLTAIVKPLRGENAFEVRVPGGPSRWATERTGEWEPVRPELVCEIEYDYFSQNRFRHGTKFLRWRPDKKPDTCSMDQVDAASRGGSLKKLGMV